MVDHGCSGLSTRASCNDHTVHGAVFCGDPMDEDDPYGSLTNYSRTTVTTMLYSVTSMVLDVN